MKRSLFWMTFFRYLLLFLFIFTIILFFSYRHNEELYRQSLQDSLFKQAVSIKMYLVGQSPLGTEDTRRIDRYVKAIGRETGVRVTLIAPDGVVLADSETDPAKMDNHGSRPEIREAYRGKTGVSVRYSVSVKSRMLYLAIPLGRTTDIPSVLRLSCRVRQIKEIVNPFDWKITRIILIIFVISILIALTMTHNQVRPLRVLQTSLQRINRGDFKSRVYFKSRNEFKEIADQFNRLADQLQESLDAAEKSRDDLLTVIDSIGEGLLVIDGDGRVTLTNRSIETILSGPLEKGRYYWEILRLADFVQTVDTAIKKGGEAGGQLEINQRLYDLLVVRNTAKAGWVAVFHDITEFKRLERIKRDFVVNMSHELRTPLTAIKGFVETLEEEEKIVNNRYLEIIKRHTERMIHLVNDLLLLSEIEDKNGASQFQPVNMESLIEGILHMFEKRSTEKRIDMRMTTQAGIPPVLGEPFKLEQLVINLVDNALKYTDEGGTVRLNLSLDGDMVRMEVADSGVGIAPEHQDRVFERFYVIDPSRSRSTGGTGLGLSIVKHIVLLHQGRIRLESRAGEGTRFQVYLPVAPGK